MKIEVKENVRYHIDFRSDWINVSAFFAGISFFLLVVYYFGFTNLRDCSGGEILLCMLLPMLLLGAFMVLLRMLRFSVTPLYGILGTAYCMFVILRTVFFGSVPQMILAAVCYLIAAVVYMGTALGYISSKKWMLIVLLIPAALRFLFFDLGSYLLKLRIVAFIPEAAAICGLVAFALLAMCLSPDPVKQRTRSNQTKPAEDR